MNVTLTCEYPEDMMQMALDADENKLTQVLRNFISNGLKFTPAGGELKVRVKLKVRLMLEVERKITISFSGNQ